MPLNTQLSRTCGPSSTSTVRRLLGAVTAGALAVALAGCTAELNGLVGLTVDGQGRVVAAIAVCEGTVDGLVLYDESSSDEEPVELGQWTVEAGPGLTLTPLSQDGSDERGAQLGIPGESEVSISGYGGELQGANRWFAPGPYFTDEDLAALGPGQVLWESSELHVTNAAEFEAAACDEAGG
jgi:hypothetical protein